MKMKLNKNVTITIFLVALFVQLIIISYNYFTGYIEINNISNFFIRLIIGTSFSFVFALFLVILDLILINNLDKKFPLPQKLVPRIPLELIFAVVIGILIGTATTVVAGTLMPYDDGLFKNVINNSLITVVINIIIISVIEAIIWFKRNQSAELKTEKLERENSEIKFETLKSQLNPHFLFNSLNVLSSLIKKNPDKAQQFVDEFSSVYRYTLDVIDKQVVELKDEVEFAKAYLYLQSIRFGNAVKYEVNIDANKLCYLVPPLSLQTLLENCFKHNIASEDSQLEIQIYNEGDSVIVVNNLNPKTAQVESKKIGLSNLQKRYALFGVAQPEFIYKENEYVAKIPLLKFDE